MSVRCGYKVNKECTESVCLKEKCNDYTLVWTGKDFESEVLRAIARIYSEYPIRSIKSRGRKYDSLRYMMGICGHCIQFDGDYDDIFYSAGVVVLLQQHVFKECSIWDRLGGYRLIRKLNIGMDKTMRKDYKKVYKISKKIEQGKYLPDKVRNLFIRK